MVTFAAMQPDQIIQFGPFQTTFIEIIAVFFGLLSVWYMKKEWILAFPFGILNVLIYVYICYQAKLYAYASINVFYFIMSVYGWYNWSRKDQNNKTIRITQCSTIELLINGVIIVLCFFLIRYVLIRFTDSSLPNWDALTTAIYMVAQWLLSRKKIENWILWIAGDFISVGLFASQNLYFSSFQYLVFTVIATMGFLEWRIKLIK